MPEQRVIRRLAAILAADVAGYSRLMGEDEEGTHERLKVHLGQLVEPKIKEHRGRTVKNTGDGLLAEFASVVDAVRCAVKIQHGMLDREQDAPYERRIAFRIGINLGDVIVEEHDIFGDGVNVAARLEALAEPGGVCISQIVHDQVHDKIDVAFEDTGEQRVKNITRPIRVYRFRGADAAAKISIAPAASLLPLPDKPSVAVLPFTNMSSDPEQEFLADGIAEDVITALSRYPSLFVIARNSSFTYKGRAVDVKQVGRELGVRYVLEGSLRKSSNRIRVTAQLVEAEIGRHVWAERHDRDLADIFALQDEITEAVTIAIAPAIDEAEQRRAMRKPPESLDAWAAYQRGLWHLGKATAGEYELAKAFFQQAVDLDHNFADGYCGLATAELRAATISHTRDPAEAQSSAERLARLAIALDGNNALAHSCLSFALFVRADYAGALAEAERVVTLSPNLAAGYFQRGTVLIYSGRPQEGLRDLQTSLRLEPRGSNLATQLAHVAAGCYFSRAYDEAVEAAEHLIRLFPEYSSAYRRRAAALGQLGHIEAAKAALAKAIAIAPAAFERYVRERSTWLRPEDYAHMLDGLRKAGWQG